ncbi:hypothetical protein MtrunA17_Chr8g0362011 [Medicago truncatula]|nr:hypothetical protein MtrunA17_Chr8g0362011 [Medicago truncatula]
MLKVLIIQSSKEEQPPLRTWQPESTRVSECLKSHLTYIHIESHSSISAMQTKYIEFNNVDRV